MTIHLFRKDLRRLGMLMLAVSALAAFQAFVQGHGAPRFLESAARWRQLEALLTAATMFGWALLITLAVQEDGLTGSDEDWLTRPIGWRHLLQAKILFLIAVVMLPMTLSQFYVVWAQGFSPWQHLTGLCTQVLMNTGTFLLPALGLAALTKNVAQAVLGGFLFVLAMAAVETSGVLRSDSLGEMDWVRSLAMYSLITFVAVGVTLWQYVTRRVAPARVAAAVGALLFIGSPAAVTWGGAQSIDHLRWKDVGGLQVRLGDPVPSAQALKLPSVWQSGETSTWVGFPLEVSGIQPAHRLRAAGGRLDLVAPDGDRIQTSPLWAEFMRHELLPDGRIRYRLIVNLPNGFYARHATQSLHLSGELSFGVVRPETPVTVRPGERAVEVPGVGRCSAYYSSPSNARQLFLDCRQPYQTPAALDAVLRRPGMPDAPSDRHMSGRAMFEPLPAHMDFNPMVDSFATWLEPSDAGEIIATPLTGVQLVRRQLQASGVHLQDYSARR
jgi:hypothetical protein